MSEKPISPLRQRMLEDMSMRRFVPDTQREYIGAVKRLATFLGRSPDTATPEELRAFQLHLTETGAQPPTINAVAKNYYEQETRSSEQFLKEVIGILYRVGAVGVKLRNGNRYLYSHIDETLLPIAQITDDARVRIHPMLWGSYRITNRPEAA